MSTGVSREGKLGDYKLAAIVVLNQYREMNAFVCLTNRGTCNEREVLLLPSHTTQKQGNVEVLHPSNDFVNSVLYCNERSDGMLRKH